MQTDEISLICCCAVLLINSMLIHAHMPMHTYTHTHIHIGAPIYICKLTCMHTCTDMRTHQYLWAQSIYIRVNGHGAVNMCMHVCTHVNTGVHSQKCTWPHTVCTRVHTCKHTKWFSHFCRCAHTGTHIHLHMDTTSHLHKVHGWVFQTCNVLLQVQSGELGSGWCRGCGRHRNHSPSVLNNKLIW